MSRFTLAICPLYTIRQASANNRFPNKEKYENKGADYVARNPGLLVALFSLSSRLLLEAAEIDLLDKCLGDEVKRVNLLLHLNISNLQRMLRHKQVVVHSHKRLAVYYNVAKRVR